MTSASVAGSAAWANGASAIAPPVAQATAITRRASRSEFFEPISRDLSRRAAFCSKRNAGGAGVWIYHVDLVRVTGFNEYNAAVPPALSYGGAFHQTGLLVNNIAKNILAVMAGFVVGSVANIVLVNLGPIVIPLPEGADVSTMEGLQASMELFAPAHFLFPFLEHAPGTLVGALVAAKIAGSHKMKFALGVGVLFLCGGIAMVKMLGGPMWFNVCDLALAYLPMGFLGGFLATRKPTQTA